MKKLLHIIVSSILCIGVACVLYDSISFPDHSYFFKEEYFDPFTNINVFNGWANLLFVTNLALLFTAAVFVATAYGVLKSGKALSSTLLVITTCCQAFVMVVYVSMQLAFGGKWGLYALKPSAYHNLGGNLWVHVVCPVAVIFYFAYSLKSSEAGEKVSLKRCSSLIFSALGVYYLIAKIIGETCFSFKWFPYPLFTPKAIWNALFGGLSAYNAIFAHLLLLVSIAAVGGIIFSVIWLIVRIYNKKR